MACSATSLRNQFHEPGPSRVRDDRQHGAVEVGELRLAPPVPATGRLPQVELLRYVVPVGRAECDHPPWLRWQPYVDRIVGGELPEDRPQPVDGTPPRDVRLSAQPQQVQREHRCSVAQLG